MASFSLLSFMQVTARLFRSAIVSIFLVRDNLRNRFDRSNTTSWDFVNERDATKETWLYGNQEQVDLFASKCTRFHAATSTRLWISPFKAPSVKLCVCSCHKLKRYIVSQFCCFKVQKGYHLQGEKSINNFCMITIPQIITNNAQ